MPLPHLRAAGLALAVALAVPAAALASKKLPVSPDPDATIVHVLNRLGFGPRPGDVAKVRAMGLDKWIDQQLHPERIADPAVATRLGPLRTLHLSTGELIARYEVPPQARNEIQEKKAELGNNPSEEQVRAARREFMQKYRDRMDGTPQDVVQDLQSAKVLRAAYSERQLDEVLADFWINHFNVFAGKGPVKFMIGEYERDVIRPHAWGKFEDLLRATAESPAMLFYLDNWLSADPNAQPAELRDRPPRGRLGRGPFGRRPWFMGDRPAAAPPGQGKGQKRGLNENYAREIMELHTLGVDGGYTQKDVTELAKILTGWTIQEPRRGGGFEFNERMHQPGSKVFLGHVIKEDGEREGAKVIEMLAKNHSTARFISRKLAVRFVSDDPPSVLVDRMAKTFLATDGDIREVLRTLFRSPEFWAADDYRAKVKTPLEFVVSAVRATATEVSNPLPLVQALNRLGMPLYGMQPPTGYSMKAEAWVNSSALVNRMNFALALGNGKLRGVQPDTLILLGPQ